MTPTVVDDSFNLFCTPFWSCSSIPFVVCLVLSKKVWLGVCLIFSIFFLLFALRKLPKCFWFACFGISLSFSSFSASFRGVDPFSLATWWSSSTKLILPLATRRPEFFLLTIFFLFGLEVLLCSESFALLKLLWDYILPLSLISASFNLNAWASRKAKLDCIMSFLIACSIYFRLFFFFTLGFCSSCWKKNLRIRFWFFFTQGLTAHFRIIRWVWHFRVIIIII